MSDHENRTLLIIDRTIKDITHDAMQYNRIRTQSSSSSSNSTGAGATTSSSTGSSSTGTTSSKKDSTNPHQTKKHTLMLQDLVARYESETTYIYIYIYSNRIESNRHF